MVRVHGVRVRRGAVGRGWPAWRERRLHDSLQLCSAVHEADEEILGADRLFDDLLHERCGE